MDYFRLREGNLEILKSDKEGVVLEIIIIDEKEKRFLLAEFKHDEEDSGFVFQNYFTDLNKKLQDSVDVEVLGQFFHLMCYIVNNFILPPDEQLAFPDSVMHSDEDNSDSDTSFLTDISDIDFDDIKKKLDDED